MSISPPEQLICILSIYFKIFVIHVVFLPHRFLLESLEDLDRSLRKLNSRLFVVRGQPAEVFPRLFKVCLWISLQLSYLDSFIFSNSFILIRVLGLEPEAVLETLTTFSVHVLRSSVIDELIMRVKKKKKVRKFVASCVFHLVYVLSLKCHVCWCQPLKNVEQVLAYHKIRLPSSCSHRIVYLCIFSDMTLFIFLHKSYLQNLLSANTFCVVQIPSIISISPKISCKKKKKLSDFCIIKKNPWMEKSSINTHRMRKQIIADWYYSFS